MTTKLQSALIETGKEVEQIKETPSIAEMDVKFERFKRAIERGDMWMMRKYGREMSAMITRFMIDTL